ncbi:MAG: DVU0772 family protein, partial [Thermodesulfobacteriota bacterium]
MLSLEELKKDRETVSRIDWDLTPQEAYQAYQIKSIDAWKHRNLPDAYYFVIYVWKNQGRLVLVRKTYKDSEEIAGIDAPKDLLR